MEIYGREYLSEAQLAEYYVQPQEKKRALEKLEELEDDGADIEKILRVKDKYYREKILTGLVPISALIYTRIMLEKPIPKPNEEPRRCLRCGKEITRFRLYCSECKEIRNSASKTEIQLYNGSARFGGKKSNHRGGCKDF